MPHRSYASTANYRFGFNGKENDNEPKGLGNQQDYGMRIYDPRLGKFQSIDPLTRRYPNLTPYQFSSNRPIDGIDQDGLEWELSTTNSNLKDKANSVKISPPFQPTVSQLDNSKKTFTQKWRDSENLLSRVTYDMANGLYTFPQQLTASIRKEEFVFNIGGNAYRAHGIWDEKQRVTNFASFAGTIIPGSAASKAESFLANKAELYLTKFENGIIEQIPSLNKLESKIVEEASNILNSRDFVEIRKAFEKGVEASIKVGKRTIRYVPEFKEAGMTSFGENGFIIGPAAFTKSPTELGKTVLHELYRLFTQSDAALNSSLGAGNISKFFDFAPRDFAERAINYLKW